MAAICFSVYGFDYESGVLAIERMYLTAVEALSKQAKDCKDREAAIERGEQPESAKPQSEIYSASVMIEHELAGIEESIQLLRQSSLLMVYHFWERQVVGWAKYCTENAEATSDHKAYLTICEQLGIEVDPDGLETLRLTANVVKHGQGRKAWACLLWEHRPDLFSGDIKRADASHEFLALTHDHMFELFSAASASGPKAFSSFNPITLT